MRKVDLRILCCEVQLAINALRSISLSFDVACQLPNAVVTKLRKFEFDSRFGHVSEQKVRAFIISKGIRSRGAVKRQSFDAMRASVTISPFEACVSVAT